jgi:hypothetical protein
MWPRMRLTHTLTTCPLLRWMVYSRTIATHRQTKRPYPVWPVCVAASTSIGQLKSMNIRKSYSLCVRAEWIWASPRVGTDCSPMQYETGRCWLSMYVQTPTAYLSGQRTIKSSRVQLIAFDCMQWASRWNSRDLRHRIKLHTSVIII